MEKILRQLPITGKIIDFLNFLDCFTFRQTCKTNNVLMKKKQFLRKTDFSCILHDKLKKLVIDPNCFLKELEKSEGYISGSFILQCIYGIDYEDSDIDVYHLLHETKDKKINDILTSCKNFYNGNKGSSFKKYIHTNFKLLKSNQNYITQTVHQSLYGFNKTKINLLMIEPSNQYQSELQYIRKIFDFSICKVAYFPKQNKLYIFNITDLIQKKGTYSSTKIITERCLKQFSYLYSKEVVNKILSLRVKKYERRGFKIKDVQPFHERIDPMLYNYETMYPELFDKDLKNFKDSGNFFSGEPQNLE